MCTIWRFSWCICCWWSSVAWSCFCQCIQTTAMPSVLWHCWLGSRKGIWPVKMWVLGCWRGYMSGARCRLGPRYGPADATATHFLASVKSRLVLPLWYQLTSVVPDKGPLNGCVCIHTTAISCDLKNMFVWRTRRKIIRTIVFALHSYWYQGAS